MSATAAPYGLIPTEHMTGGEIRPRAFPGGIASAYASSIWKGDPVIFVTGGTFQRATNGGLIDGVFAGVEYDDSTGARHVDPFYPTTTTMTNVVAYVWVDKNIIYRMQCNGSLAQTAMGDAADIVLANGSNLSGNSKTPLSSTLVGAGNSAQLKIVGLYQDQANAWGDAFTDVLVIINEPGLSFIAGNAV